MNINVDELARSGAIINKIRTYYNSKIVGQSQLGVSLLVSMIANGHILLESVPGLAKTTAAKVMTEAVGGSFSRVQCTPDLLPSDIIGTQTFNMTNNTFETKIGPVYANFLLLDEINRSSAKTQSAMLEAMQERSVSIGGQTYKLPPVFIVIATQNPTGASGTSLLPDSQIDRFMIRLSIGYPSAKDEKAMIESRKNGFNPMDNVKTVCDVNTILQMQAEVNNVFMHDNVIDYIVTLINKTRGHKNLIRGGSPRATLALTSMAKACAYLNGRNYVVPSDVQKVFLPVITHRLMLTPEAEINGVKTNDIAQEILKDTLSPKI